MNMKGNICGVALGVFLAVMSAGMAGAQEYVGTPVEISKEKVKIDGKLCYSHIVLERQTLYSISKAYGVSIDDIYRFNPSIKDTGLKKNSIIIIPSQSALKADQTAQKEEAKINHSTTAKDHGADKSQDKKVRHTGQTVSEPEAEVVREDSRPAERTARIHIAKWYEDLDVIAEQYGVTVEDIMKANNLKGRKLSKRQKLIIPYPGEENAAENVPAPVVKEEKPLETITEAIKNLTETVDSIISIKPKTDINATLLLPLTTGEGGTNRNNMDFYCGALLAVYDMAQSGINCKLNVYDIMNSNAHSDRESLGGSDMIIGPVSSADLTKLFNAIGSERMVVSPLDPRAERLVADNTSMVHIPTPQTTQYRDLVKWVEEDYKEGDRVVMITEKGARQTAVTTTVKEAVDSSSFAYNTFSYSILEGRDVTESLTGLMTAEGTNRVLIASESEAFVNDVIRNLNLLIYNNLDIVLYAPSRTRNFETIEVDNLHKTSMPVSLAYFIDYESPQVKDFLLKYRALFNTEPNQFAFQGYDVTKYFIDLCSKYGDKWAENIENADAQMLQSTFSLRRQPTGGFTNTGVRRIVYENGYSVRKVK